MHEINRRDGTVITTVEAPALKEAVEKAVWNGTDLRNADLGGADLRVADLRNANLRIAYLRGADLGDATMPDGRKWEDYRQDHYAGICDSDEVRAKADAAWGKHRWADCPMHEALGIDAVDELTDEDKQLRVACWVALYDAHLLPHPVGVK